MENVIDKTDRPHLVKDDDESSSDDEEEDAENIEQKYKEHVKTGLEIALKHLGIGAKAETDDLLSMVEAEEE